MILGVGIIMAKLFTYFLALYGLASLMKVMIPPRTATNRDRIKVFAGGVVGAGVILSSLFA